MTQVTFYDLGAEEHTLDASLLSSGEVRVILKNEENETVYKEISHTAAWDSLVYIARQILACDKYIDAQRELRG